MRPFQYYGQLKIEQDCALRYRKLAHHCRRLGRPALFRTNLWFARMHMRILHRLLTEATP